MTSAADIYIQMLKSEAKEVEPVEKVCTLDNLIEKFHIPQLELQSDPMQNKLDQILEKLTNLDEKLDQIDEQLTRLDHRLSQLENFELKN